ncbi:uracil phosphoribosyltransferase [Maioricimonas sp. JC845]|uniref:uracil phosphoribosyltransferase n=1 Tax=Maioricimonas sp. JC845 TaxID=3232138 RepID=UPI0034587330
MASLRVLDHPVVQHHLSLLRDERTGRDAFRLHVERVAALLAFEVTRDLPTREISVRTPLTETTGRQLQLRLGLVPILRAGLGMVRPVLDLIPGAEVWHLGMYRDEATAQPVEYYSKLSTASPVDRAIVLDPMLATGGSVTAALAELARWGVKETSLMSIIASQAGVERVQSEFPDVDIVVGAVDPELNEQKFIVPGLGDAGDRMFNA